MTEPLVVAIMLTKDRPEMAKRAVECFRQQTYKNRFMLAWNTGKALDWASIGVKVEDSIYDSQDLGLELPCESIGGLRNQANHIALDPPFPRALHARPEILVHWDDDDWSHPNRISEQVALLQASGKQVVGYRDMLFWRSPRGPHDVDPMERTSPALPGEAWLYSNADPRFCLGTSMCYWREVWEKRPFPDQPKPGKMTGEDKEFCRDRDTLGVSSMLDPTKGITSAKDLQPRIIASIHGGNSSDQYADVIRRVEKGENLSNWKRVPQWDEHCRKVMAL
jgi:hypothetical protein